MAAGAFTSKEHKPSADEIHEAMGRMLQGWHDLVGHIRGTYHAQEEFAFLYGKKYGWGMRFCARGKLLTALYPNVGGFTVQVILNDAAVERATKLKLGACVRDAISRAKPYPEGRWLFVAVKSKQDVIVAKRLLELKAGATAAHAPKKSPSVAP